MDRYLSIARRDSVEEVLEDLGGQVAGVAAVGGEADTPREVLDRVEVGHGPMVREHAGETHDAVDSGGTERVGQRGSSDEFEGGIDAAGEQLTDLGRNGAVVDQRMVDADAP